MFDERRRGTVTIRYTSTRKRDSSGSGWCDFASGDDGPSREHGGPFLFLERSGNALLLRQFPPDIADWRWAGCRVEFFDCERLIALGHTTGRLFSLFSRRERLPVNIPLRKPDDVVVTFPSVADRRFPKSDRGYHNTQECVGRIADALFFQ